MGQVTEWAGYRCVCRGLSYPEEGTTSVLPQVLSEGEGKYDGLL